jgi:VanZ family protein
MPRTAVWRWLVAVLLLAGLAWSLRPLAPSEGPENWFPNADKLHHFWFFAVLWWLGLRTGLLRGWTLGLVLFIYGVGIELAQGLTITRSASVDDVVADMAGVLLGVALTRRLTRRPASSGQPEEHGG